MLRRDSALFSGGSCSCPKEHPGTRNNVLDEKLGKLPSLTHPLFKSSTTGDVIPRIYLHRLAVFRLCIKRWVRAMEVVSLCGGMSDMKYVVSPVSRRRFPAKQDGCMLRTCVRAPFLLSYVAPFSDDPCRISGYLRSTLALVLL